MLAAAWMMGWTDVCAVDKPVNGRAVSRALGDLYCLPRKARLKTASIFLLVNGFTGPLAMASSIHF